ncbi:xanthine dehydrogenase family protein molybdopterin-binding subunit [Acidobacteria bacterium AH-259-G07]|nr:xanthine dehydrogenase family protein molybdopterin-binding subunit [Acidobacteria bacterium AH-259-G07]
MARVFGSSIKRREDPSLITGAGQYTDDLKLPNMAYAAIVRSPHAHARIRSIDTSKATALDGVTAVFTGEDIKKSGTPGVVPVGWLLPDMKIPPHPVLASETVRYVGDAVAVVLAEDRYRAQDAVDLVEVDYDPLAVVTNPAKTVEEGAPQLHAEAANNIAFDWELGDKTKTDEAFPKAAHVLKVNIRNNRLIPQAIEPRAALASYDDSKGQLTVWMTSQNPHIHRLLMSLASLGLPEHKIRVIAPEVGGGFGSKIHHYPDEVIACWCSMQLHRPVKWTATRTEANLTDTHGRDHVTEAEMALDENGRILGLRVKTYANMGAYLSTFGPLVPTYLHGTLLSGEYDIPAIYCNVIGTFTNTTPVDTVRGAGRPEATFIIERLMDLAAEELGLDPVEIRRRNFISPDAFPYQTQVALQYDSGNYGPALDRALEMVNYKNLRAEQERRRGEGGKLLGVGLSTYIEACGLAPSAVVGSLGAQAGQWESGEVRVHPTGTVTVYTGSSAHGQGHHTTFAQIVADRLGIDADNVEVIHGDTDQVPFGWGTYGSRSAAVGGSAIAVSADKVIEKGRQIAAHLLEASEEDVVFEEGKFFVRGAPDKSQTLNDIALQAHLAHNLPPGVEPGLSATSFYDPANFTFPFGTHIAVLEVDPETGEVKLLRYVAVDDVGNVINPMIVDGQIHGGIAHGIAQALWEEAIYDGNGQLLTGELLDYAVPKPHMLVSFELDRTVTPCPHNPLGVKGVGETGTIASPAAVVNAVVDALKSYGIKHLDMPLTPEKIWRAIHQSGRS